ncbi:MAG: transposase, partial [Bacteroidales bacterium]|nr:transposase [Bacteroidales bacterium]
MTAYHTLKTCQQSDLKRRYLRKGVSSRLLRKEFPELKKYYWKGGLWSPSYF